MSARPLRARGETAEFRQFFVTATNNAIRLKIRRKTVKISGTTDFITYPTFDVAKRRQKSGRGCKMENSEKVFKNDISVFDGRLNYIRPALAMLSVLALLRDKSTNELRATQTTLAVALSDKRRTVAKRTVTEWRRVLALNGCVKYRKGGFYILNPLYVFEGTQDEFARAVETWNDYPGEITPLYNNNIKL